MSNSKIDINFIAYPGNKKRFFNKIYNKIEKYINDSTFIEIFGGSGITSLNIGNKYNKNINSIIFNEIDPNIYKIHYSFKNGTFEILKNIINEIHQSGDPFIDKDYYYYIRNLLNQKYFNSNSIESGFYNWAISCFAINSMIRFGPNGFNQGWGTRGPGRINPLTKMTRQKFDSINNSYKKIKIYNKDYSDILVNIENYKNPIIFADPPYVDMHSGTYNFDQNDYNIFIETIKNIEYPIVYTDIYSKDRLRELGDSWNFEILRNSIGSAKVGKSKTFKQECLYYNFELSHKLF